MQTAKNESEEHSVDDLEKKSEDEDEFDEEVQTGNEVDPKGKCDEDLGDWSKSEYGDLEGVWSSGEEGVDSGNGKEKDQWGGQGRMNEEQP